MQMTCDDRYVTVSLLCEIRAQHDYGHPEVAAVMLNYHANLSAVWSLVDGHLTNPYDDGSSPAKSER